MLRVPFVLRPQPKTTRWNLRKPQVNNYKFRNARGPVPVTSLHVHLLGVVVLKRLHFRDVGMSHLRGTTSPRRLWAFPPPSAASCSTPSSSSLPGLQSSCLPVSLSWEKFTRISWSPLTTGEEEAREAAKEEGVGDGDEDGSAGTLRNSFRLHRRPVVPRLCLAAAELLRGGNPGPPGAGREGHGPAPGERQSWSSGCPQEEGGAGAAGLGVGWHKQWIRLWPLPASGGFGGTFFVLRLCFCPSGCDCSCPGGRKGEESPAGERRRGGGPSGQMFAWPGGAVRCSFEGWIYIFLNCDKFRFLFLLWDLVRQGWS